MKRVHLLVGAVAAISLAGCASGRGQGNNDPHGDGASASHMHSSPVRSEVDRQFEQEHPGVGNYLAVWGCDRWRDLLDVFHFDISVGRGFGFNAHITEFAQVGINWWEGTSWGMRGRSWGTWDTTEVDRGLGPFYWVEYERRPTYGSQTLFDHDYKYTGWDFQEAHLDKSAHDDWSDCGAMVHLFAVGASVGASPFEAVDFIVGVIPISLVMNLFGAHHPPFDPMQDGTHAQIEQRLREEKGLGQ